MVVASSEGSRYLNGYATELSNLVFADVTHQGRELRFSTELLLPSVRTITYGEHSLRYMAPCVWREVPKSLKNSKWLSVFKQSIRKWKPSNCSCSLCKNYVQNLGYVDVL